MSEHRYKREEDDEGGLSQTKWEIEGRRTGWLDERWQRTVKQTQVCFSLSTSQTKPMKVQS